MTGSSSRSEIFSARLRAARDYRGLTQGDLAKLTGLKPAAVSHFETGGRKPSFDNLRLLADKLDVTTDYLLGRVAHFKDLAGADELHRHYSALKDGDRKFTDELITLLASRARSKTLDKK
jgi:transcriptional regulator with XRE-family HTH domain